MIKKISGFLVLLLSLGLFLQYNAIADEGMWTFDNPPTKLLQQQYNFTPTADWLDHVRLSSVRFMDGGSGSFVSPNGLVMTNHHVAMFQLQKLSTAENNYVATGFYAATLDKELKCPDLEVNILVDLKNVTTEVRAAITTDMSEAEALKARDAEIARLEKESLDATGNRSNVVNLYHGGEYWLYVYKKYTDVRLVMAPERQAAYFGGDYDNFTYPRYDLDVAFFRVYENDKPVESPHYFKWSASGAAENELVFIIGNPGSTDRLLTYAQLEVQRDHTLPMLLNYIDKRIQILQDYSQKGQEQQRRALGQIFGLENSNKALTGMLNGLKDKDLMEKKKADEEKFRQLVASNPEWNEKYGDAWDIIAEAASKSALTAKERFYQTLRSGRLTQFATQIVRYVSEIKKPDAERLEGYHDSELEPLKFNLLSPAPIYKDQEQAILLGTLKMSVEELGTDDEFIKTILDGKSPDAVVTHLITKTKLDDPAYREELIKKGEKAVLKSSDPLIQLALKIDPYMRDKIQWYRDNVESIMTRESERIAEARFAVYGKDTYPDATFTLRLGYGTAKGYPYNGTIAPYKTTLYGLYDRALSFRGNPAFALPQRFWDRKDKLDLSTPANFVHTCDAVGGSSGSPTINANAEIVGILFDGNIESLVGDYYFDIEKNRSVSVHSSYIMHALRTLYDANELADEIEK
ncbi:S46 family peptidase [candidate division KSB1 bacterium]|nr:S46 family peptidase [candidate division KSB1 bacterium]